MVCYHQNIGLMAFGPTGFAREGWDFKWKGLIEIPTCPSKIITSGLESWVLAQRPLARYFDDNKPYLVMCLTILFKRISGLKQVDLTAPQSRLTIWTPLKICIPKPSTVEKLRDQTLKKRIKICNLLLFLDILSKPRW